MLKIRFTTLLGWFALATPLLLPVAVMATEKTYREIGRFYYPDWTAIIGPPSRYVDQFWQNPPADLPEVKLKPGEKLIDAAQAVYKAQGAYGAKILVDNPLQCDSLFWRHDKLPLKHLVIEGIVRPRPFVDSKGKTYLREAPPRFFCRMDDRARNGRIIVDGTIPRERVRRAGAFIVRQLGDLWLINMEVDGYQGFAQVGNVGNVYLRNVYAHSSSSDGLTSRNNGKLRHPDGFYASLFGESCDLKLTMVNTMLSHFGSGNLKHNTYFKQCLGGTRYAPKLTELVSRFLPEGETDVRTLGVFPDHGQQINFIDSVSHSPRFSSALKGLSASFNILNSKLATTASLLGIDDGLPEDWSQAVIDIAMMASVNIIDSEIYCAKDGNRGGGLCIGARNRKTKSRGAGDFIVYDPVNRGKIFKGKGGKKHRTVPRVILPDSPLLTERFWNVAGGVKTHQWLIKDTRVTEYRPDPKKARSNNWLKVYGTNWVWDNNQRRCMLEMPANAYELVEVLLDNVTVEGFLNLDYLSQGPDSDLVPEHTIQNCAYGRPPYPTAKSFYRYGSPVRKLN